MEREDAERRLRSSLKRHPGVRYALDVAVPVVAGAASLGRGDFRKISMTYGAMSVHARPNPSTLA